MNKELIKKYKKEFDHWLNGGELLSKHPDESNWYLVTTVLWNCPKMQYVIDDKYVEFRKALAEGKVVQKQDYYSKQWIDMKNDNFHSASDTQYEGVYRIKPEEPKFKVGDWVLHRSKGVCKIEKISPSNEPDDKNVWLYNKGACFINELELWEPKPGEWCWFHKYKRLWLLDR